MLLGMIASASEDAVPLASLGTLDFVAGTYEYNATSYTAAQVIDQTGWIGASGLAIPGSAGAGAEIILSPLTTRLATCQWTMVLAVELLVTTPKSLLFTEANSGQAYYIEIAFDTEWDASCDGGPTNPFAADVTHSISTGIHKIAVTRIDNNIALSVDGFAFEFDSTACTLPVEGFPMTAFFLGGYSDYTLEAVRIRSLTLYDPVADATLPALSA